MPARRPYNAGDVGELPDLRRQRCELHVAEVQVVAAVCSLCVGKQRPRQAHNDRGERRGRFGGGMDGGCRGGG